MVNQEYQGCTVTFLGRETIVDLMLLDIIDFDVIFMDWLSHYHAILDCHTKTVTLSYSNLPS